MLDTVQMRLLWVLAARNLLATRSAIECSQSCRRGYLLKECLGDVEGVNLVGLGHDGRLGRLHIAFRHDVCEVCGAAQDKNREVLSDKVGCETDVGKAVG